MAVTRARASFFAPAMIPKATTQAKPRQFIAIMAMKLVRGVGFSKGWAELAFMKPPPLVPICLMASWLAMGPKAMVCLAPSIVVGVHVLREASAARPER